MAEELAIVRTFRQRSPGVALTLSEMTTAEHRDPCQSYHGKGFNPAAAHSLFGVGLSAPGEKR